MVCGINNNAMRNVEGRDVGGAVPYMVCENINVVGDNTHC